jgi:hypothetical protein
MLSNTNNVIHIHQNPIIKKLETFSGRDCLPTHEKPIFILKKNMFFFYKIQEVSSIPL